MRLQLGDAAPEFVAEDIKGERVELPRRPNQFLLLSFLRYASCPMCLLRTDELADAAPRLQAKGVEVVVLMHSPRKRILQHLRSEPRFRVIADPARRLYRLYRVEASWPRLAFSTLRPSFYMLWAVATMRGHFGGWIDGEFARMPADFLIDGHGTIVRAHYGAGIGDHMDLLDIPPLVGENA